MLEIILLIYLCGRIGRIVEPKGHRSGLYKLFLVIAWFGGEFGAAFITGMLLAIFQGDVEPSLAVLYPAALAGAALGTMAVFLAARAAPDLRAATPATPLDTPAFQALTSVPPAHGTDNPYQPPGSFDQAAQVTRHSGPGLASFFIALLVGAAEIALIFYAGYIEASTPGGLEEDSPIAVAVGFGVCFGIMMHAVGLTLAVVGLIQSQRKRLFPVLGMLFNGFVVGGIVLLMLVGFALS